MLGSILYKEYAKTYKIAYLFIIITTLSLFGVFLNIKNIFEYGEATGSILMATNIVINLGYMDYILPISAIVLGIFQYYPEISNARIRLYLHLPINTLSLITILLFIGFTFLVIVFLFIVLFYHFMLNAYYPNEIFWAVLTKIVPIFLTSLLCYATTILAFLEPINKRKLLYIAVSYLILSTYIDYTYTYFVGNLLDKVMLVIIGVYIATIYRVFNSYTEGYIKWKNTVFIQ